MTALAYHMNEYTIMEHLDKIPTPSYVVDKRLLKKNLELLQYVQEQSNAKILLALKGFSMYSFFPFIGEYLAGVTSSSLFEAKLGYEEMGKEVHIYAPAYQPKEIEEITDICDHIVFNSFRQYTQYKEKVIEKSKKRKKPIEVGIRINPEYSELKTAIYDPCAPNSRLGVTLDNFDDEMIEEFDGIHFHTMCEQNADTLKRTIKKVEEKFGEHLHKMKWINFGGGHHITREDYDVQTLIETIIYVQDTYNVQVYIEPGEAIALNTGFLVTSVVDVVKNNMDIAIVDTSAACHMPDVLEMPYRPMILHAKEANEEKYTYRFGGMTCLAGDIIGDYSFKKPLEIGEKLVFTDMAHYTMVKNNTFNGVNLPSIYTLDDKGLRLIKEFSYEDYKRRL